MSSVKENIEKIKDSIKLNKRAIELVEKISPRLIVCEVIDAIVKATIPYIEIVFSAFIINELVGERNFNALLLFVLLLICSMLVLGFVDQILIKKISVKKDIFAESHEIFLNSYSFSMDFEKVEDADTTELREQIEGIMDTENGGLKAVSSHIGELCKNLTSVVIACVMCFNMVFVFEYAKVKTSWIISNWFTLLFLGLIILCIITISFLEKKQKKKMFQVTIDGTKYNKYIGYYLWEYLDDNMYAKDIRIFNQSEVVTSEMQNMGFGTWVRIFKACEKLEKRYGGLNSFISALISGVVYIFIALRAFAGVISIGNVIKYYGAINQLITSVSGVSNAFTSIGNNNLYLNLVFEYIDLGKENHVGEKEVIPNKDGLYEFEFHNVSFKYPGTDEYALKNISLKINGKKRLAIVGMNGSGKTTMIKLLCGLYKPDEGYITLNGVNIDEYDYQQYKQLFSVVFQDFKLFALPLGENVAVKNSYDSQDIWNVLERVGIKARVEKLEKKLDNAIYKQFDDTGVDISGGEEQKIAIARALYRDANIYILDEPTAALDPEAEFEIYSKMNELTCGNTVIFISHRLSSCCYSDKIIVFNNGEIVQVGTHVELLKDVNGKYYELWNAQAKHYQKENAVG